MGAVSVGGQFKGYDWATGIRAIQEEAAAEYGHQDGYSGAENSCNFSYAGDKSHLKKSELNKFINDRLESLYKRSGEVICIGIDEYHIISTRYEEQKNTFRHSEFEETRKLAKSKYAVIILSGRWGEDCECIFKGTTLSECKNFVHKWLRNNYYKTTAYIVGNKKVIRCDGDVKRCKKTKRVSDDKILVLPVKKFAYYGVAPY